MAIFLINDYVQIKPSVDLSWDDWDEEANNPFCGRIAKIVKIIPDFANPKDRNEDIVRVCSFFPEGFYPDGPGYYYAFFKKRHLIKKTEEDYVNEMFLKGFFDENDNENLNYEKIFRRKRDEIFKYMFSSDSERQEIDGMKALEEKVKEKVSNEMFPEYDWDFEKDEN